ncbi:MAG: hypothetical protein IH950_12660 [Bacteroidetes bacterium]|nr:hypothetical protein [Bacteroidota bacterium]
MQYNILNLKKYGGIPHLPGGKKNGYPIGTVHLLREDVLLVKPEIPKSCEYISDE